MTVGIPGTGVGGLLYFVMVAFMPFHELWRLVRGRSSRARWRRVGFQWALLATILGVLWAEAWLLDRLFALFRSAGAAADPAAREHVALHVGQVAATASAAVLLLVVGGAALLRAVLARHEATPAPA